MKRFIIGILLLAIFTMSLTGCVSKKTFENVQQDLSIAEATLTEQQIQIDELNTNRDKAYKALNIQRDKSAELAIGLDQTSSELEEAQITLADTKAELQDTKAQLADLQEQIEAISEAPFGLYHSIDIPAGQLLWSPYVGSSEVLIDGYVLIRNHDDISPKSGGFYWSLLGLTAKGVEIDRDVLSGLITGPGVCHKSTRVGYDELFASSSWQANNFGSLVDTWIPCTWKEGLGWVSDYPIRVLKHPQIEYRICDIHAHWVPARFEELEPTMQVMTLALAPELIVQARESAVEAGVDFEEWLTEAILAGIKQEATP